MEPRPVCRPDCPHHGTDHDNAYLIECECGNEELVCGYCMAADRVTKCQDCLKRDAEAN